MVDALSAGSLNCLGMSGDNKVGSKLSQTIIRKDSDRPIST